MVNSTIKIFGAFWFALSVAATSMVLASPEVDSLAQRAEKGDRAALDALIDRARKRKDADAEYALGLMTYKGAGLEPNARQAFRLVERAAGKGLPEAMNTLGYFH